MAGTRIRRRASERRAGPRHRHVGGHGCARRAPSAGTHRSGAVVDTSLFETALGWLSGQWRATGSPATALAGAHGLPAARAFPGLSNQERHGDHRRGQRPALREAGRRLGHRSGPPTRASSPMPSGAPTAKSLIVEMERVLTTRTKASGSTSSRSGCRGAPIQDLREMLPSRRRKPGHSPGRAGSRPRLMTLPVSFDGRRPPDPASRPYPGRAYEGDRRVPASRGS
jgi:hypothetical protein